MLFGTEGGNAEQAAEDIVVALQSDYEIDVQDLADASPDALDPGTLYLVVSATHGDGEPPENAHGFVEALRSAPPDLVGVSYAMFGLGDTVYEHFARGSEEIDALLTAAGAQRTGEFGRHDAATRTSPSPSAVAWARSVLTPVFAR